MKKTHNRELKFVITQIILFSILIFLILSVFFNANFIIKIDEYVFNICDKFRNGFVNNLMLIITFLGESYIFVLFFILLLVFNFKKICFPLIFSTIISVSTNFILKNIIQNPRPIGEFVNNLIFPYPFPKSYSFPSGHAQTSLVFYFLLAYILLTNYYHGKHKKLILAFCSIFPILIAISRVMLGVHFFSDILGGIIIAIIIITNYIHFNKLYNNNQINLL